MPFILKKQYKKCSSQRVSAWAAFLLLLTALFFEENANSAMPDSIGSRHNQLNIENLNNSNDTKDKSQPNHKKQKAIMAISGSKWPGIIDHLLQRPLNGKEQSTIHISFPSVGNGRIDIDIREWVNSIALAFESYLNTESSMPITDIQTDSFLQDDDLNSSLQAETTKNRFELWGSYEIARPSKNAVSITFELWNYTAGQQNLDILTLNYSLITGQRLNLVDIFEKPDIALKLMSDWSRKKLIPRLGAAARPQMLLNGTEPLAENFSSLTLVPDGICINFQPWQVASWQAGIQKVKMPLSALQEAQPFLPLWGL